MKIYKRLFIPDTHSIDHDKKAFDLMLDVAKEFRPDEVIWLGDFWDINCLSKYDKDPETTFSLLRDEVQPGIDLMARVEKVTRAKKFVFLEGNHEARIRTYVSVYGPKLGGLIKPEVVLQIPKHYVYLPYGQAGHYSCGDLIATHGSLCGAHPASAMVKKYGCNIIFGHTHQLQEYHIRNISGDTFKAYNAGWLGDMKKAAAYIKNVVNWSHGFAVSYSKYEHSKQFVKLIHIEKYQCAFNGDIFSW